MQDANRIGEIVYRQISLIHKSETNFNYENKFGNCINQTVSKKRDHFKSTVHIYECQK